MAEVAPRQLQPHRSPLHGQSGALWQHPGNQGRKLTWKAALLIFQVQITHLFLAKVHISQVSSIPLGRTKSKITGSSPQVRQAVVGMNDCAGEAERRIYHPWDRLSSEGSGKVRMIPGNVLQPGVTCLLFCFTIRIKHVNHTFCHFYFITNNCRDTQLFFSPITVLLLNAESVMPCSFYDRDKR